MRSKNIYTACKIFVLFLPHKVYPWNDALTRFPQQQRRNAVYISTSIDTERQDCRTVDPFL